MTRSLLIGFGNIDRADDGVAWHIVNAVRARLGFAALPEDASGLDDIDEQTGAVFLSQLSPELIDVVVRYDRIVFVDAHIDERLEALHYETIDPETTALTFSHHITPAILLAVVEALHHAKPAAHLVSVRGYDFDFHRELSAETLGLIECAVEMVRDLIEVRD